MLLWQLHMTTARIYYPCLFGPKTQIQEIEENGKTLIIKSMESMKRKKIAVLQIIKSSSQDLNIF